MQTRTTEIGWRTKDFCRAVLLLALVSLRTLIYAQGTTFTYQGRLNDGGVPANGSYDLQFTVYDSLIGGNQQGPIRTNIAVQVNNGLFTTTLDFGPGVFTGPDRWLEISVRANSQTAFTALAPRQQLAPAAYAICAGNLSGSLPTSQLAGTISASQLPATVVVNGASGVSLAGTFAGDGSGLTGLNASSLSSGILSDQRLSANVALQGSVNNFGADQLFHGAIYLNGLGGFEQTSAGSFLVDAASQPGGRFSVLANGNVGIGNPNPASKLDVVGDAAISGNTFYGNTLRQMLNLSGMKYGIGVQSGTTYFRTDNAESGNGFSWFSGGVHSDSQNDPGAGGTELMRLTVGGLTLPGALNLGNPATIYSGNTSIMQSDTSQNVLLGPNGSFSVLANGKVIIGNANPASELDVVGNAAVSGALKAARDAEVSGKLSVGGDVSMSGNLNISKDAMVSGLNVASDALFDGNISLAAPSALSFGTQTRQMLNLWGTQYGIGVQSLTTYFRCDSVSPNNGFSWFKGGVHNDGQNNPGGGVELMRLTSLGLVVNGTFVNASDRNVKEHFAPVDSRQILEKLVVLPVSEWNYKADPSSRHMGPMAQDFYSAFGVGPDDKHITTVDEGGVALAAIQGLNQKLVARSQELEGRTRKLEAENAELKQRLSALEQIVQDHKY